MKKFLITTLVALPTFCHAQDLITKQYDEISGKTIVTSKPIVLKSDRATATICMRPMHEGTEYRTITMIVLIDGNSVYCADNSSYITVLFTDSSRLELHNFSDFNCDGSLSMFLSEGGIEDKFTASAKGKNIKAIRVSTMKSTDDFYLSNSEAIAYQSELKELLPYIEK